MPLPEVPFLALGTNFDYGFLFSRTIEAENLTDQAALFEYMEGEAGCEIHSVLIIKNDRVVMEVEDQR